jgi:2-octaprenyl-6-methoxyphenol hydroxylase
MKKQKICIVGGGLTGLITAICLSKLDIQIDLVTGTANSKFKSNRTLAISEDNYSFLKKLNTFEINKKKFWPCSKMKLYAEKENKKIYEIFHLDNENKLKKIFYIAKNFQMVKEMEKKIKRIKSISVKKADIKKINSLGSLNSVNIGGSTYKYNLIIICTGSNSDLVKNIFKDKSFKRSYEENSITTTLTHNYIKNNIARQIFFNNEILALLPISNNQTSIVWSVKKNLIKRNNLYIKKMIKLRVREHLKNAKFKKPIEYQDLNLLIREKYYKSRILLFGDALHVVHPLVGQGFNMILRDLSNLKKILNNKICLGLDMGSYDILKEFSHKIKSRNFVYSVGIDFFKNLFSVKNSTFKKFRNNIILRLNKSNITKNIFYNLADKGFKF